MYNPYSLENKTILVTGASSGIGKATAIECSKLGASVVITARNELRLKEVFDSLDTSFGQTHKMIIADVSTHSAIEELVSQLPPLDGVSSNAGTVVGNKPIKFLNDEEVHSLIEVNSLSHLSLLRLLFKKKILNKGASCVLTSSIGGNFSFTPGNAIYGMSKAALKAFSRYAAIEFAPRMVRCNCVCPGMIETPMINSGVLTDEDNAKHIDMYLSKRYGNPKEVALTTAFLLSDAASFINGTQIIIDGGYSINH